MPDVKVEHKENRISIKHQENGVTIKHGTEAVEVSHPNKNVTVDHPRGTTNIKHADRSKVSILHRDTTIAVHDGGKRGLPGANGSAATIVVGTTTTGAPDTEAEVTNVGTESAAIFDFVIPEGKRGVDGVGDKTYSMNFINSDMITVTHNLGKYPAVSVINSANDEVEGDVEYININTLIVRFIGSFSGRVTCN